VESHAGVGKGGVNGLEAGVEPLGVPAEGFAEAVGGDVLADADEQWDDVGGVGGSGAAGGGWPIVLVIRERRLVNRAGFRSA